MWQEEFSEYYDEDLSLFNEDMHFLNTFCEK